MRRVGASCVTAVHRSDRIFDLGFAGIDHWLDRQHHSFFQPRILVLAGPHSSELVAPLHRGTDPVPDHTRGRRKTVRHYVLLDRTADIEQPVAGTHLIDRQFQRLLASPQQTLSNFRPSSPIGMRHRRVTEVAVHLHSGVDGDDVARLQEPSSPTASRERSRLHRSTKTNGYLLPADGV